MNTDFQFKALSEADFTSFFELNDELLTAQKARKMIVDKKPGFPCRVSLVDAEVGEEVILLPYCHHEVSSPYRASGPVFIRKGAVAAALEVNEVPQMLLHRLLSLRAYDSSGMMVEAAVVEGNELAAAIRLFFSNAEVSYLHIHNAKPGCFNVHVNRA
jgi:hypothetical protein